MCLEKAALLKQKRSEKCVEQKSVINKFMIIFSFHLYFLTLLGTVVSADLRVDRDCSRPLACVQFSCWSLTVCLL
jgi:hypothetical protein